ncbi:MAG: sigma-70 family RNA polymerase sigma factor [Verrucomicrobia bacterium]|nr:sigma-70 family RNA polymerase sigma factor [Verrucomicrobiota bacterium]
MSAPDKAGGEQFTTTHWSVVLAAGRGDSPAAQQALERLCRTYWYPLYAFVRRQGPGPEEAQDLTQEFFARFLAKDYLGLADPARGRFRTFLLTSLKHFLAEAHRHATRLKRGGGQSVVSWDGLTPEQRYLAEPQHETTAETLYEQRWALTLLETALARLGAELAAAGKERLFTELKGQLWGEPGTMSYAELAAGLGLSEGALKVTVHRLRQRFRELLREEVAQTVANPAEVDAELRHLVAVVRRSGL